MTQKVNPSPNRPADAFTTAGAIAYGGGSRDGYIVPSSEPTELSKQDSGITESNLNSFKESSSSSSLTVSIGAGEAFIFGSWVVSDNSPSANVTLQAGVTNQTVYVGWNKDSPDDMIIGLESEFSTTATNNDQKIPLFSFDTDGSGVTNVVDERSFDHISSDSIEQGSGSSLDADTVDGIEASNIYTDEEAQDAVGTIVNDGLQYDDANNLVNVLAGNALTIDTNGNIDVVESNISHDNIAGVSSSDHHTRYSDSEAQAAVSGSNHDHDARYANTDSGGTEHPSYPTLSDVPTTVTAGDVVYIEDEGRLYIEDGT